MQKIISFEHQIYNKFHKKSISKFFYLTFCLKSCEKSKFLMHFSGFSIFMSIKILEIEKNCLIYLKHRQIDKKFLMSRSRRNEIVQ